MKKDCPRCSKQADLSSDNNFRPFCSEKCKMIDLGNWLDESYTIPVEDETNLEEEIDSDEY